MVTIHETEYHYFQERAAYHQGFNIEPDFLLTEGTLRAGNIELEVIHTPGHSPGSICLYWPSHKALFAGDVTFEQGVGRTDLPGGDYKTLIDSIRSQVLTLPPETRILNGHGPATTVQEEQHHNPFLL